MGRFNRFSAALLAIALFISIAVPAFGSTIPAEISFGQVAGSPGGEVTVPVTIKNNPGIAGFRFRIAYDPSALTYISARKGEAMIGGTLTAEYKAENEKLAITWFDVKNVTGDGVLFDLTFSISQTADGDYPLTVSCLPEDIVNATYQQVDAVVENGTIRVGSCRISGTVTSFGAEDGVTVRLLQGNAQIASTVTTGGAYELVGVVFGDYTLEFSKSGHTTQRYTLTATGDLTQNATLYLLGDVRGDGQVDHSDVIYLLWNQLFGEEMYSLTISGDVNGSGETDNDDVIYLLWHTVFGSAEYPLN